MKQYKIVKGINDRTKSTDLIITIIKRIKKSRDIFPLIRFRDDIIHSYIHSNTFFQFPNSYTVNIKPECML
jgi:hypothetical protein